MRVLGFKRLRFDCNKQKYTIIKSILFDFSSIKKKKMKQKMKKGERKKEKKILIVLF
jgi:hypothetical protein